MAPLVCIAGLCSAGTAAADSCPNATFRTGPSAGLSECRAYELVTPADKPLGTGAFGGAAVLRNDTVFLTANGTLFPEDAASGSNVYRASRAAGGWGLTPTAVTGTTGAIDVNAGFTQDIVLGVSPLVASDTDLTKDVYLRTASGISQISVGSLGGDFPGLFPGVPPDSVDRGADYVGQSADGSHVLFETREVLEPADATRTSGTQLYEWTGGQVRPVGLDSDGNLINEAGAVLGIGSADFCPSASGGGSSNAISADGARIFFESPGPCDGDHNSQLYVRENGTTTTMVSASQCDRQAPDPPCGAPQTVYFQGASTDGSRVFFTTAGQLTNDDADDNVDLYRYDLGSGTLTRLTQFQDPTPCEVPNLPFFGVAPGVCGVTAVSNDGERVYYVGTGPGVQNLYLYDGHNGLTRLIGSVPNSSAFVRFGFFRGALAGAITPDGGSLVLQTGARLTSFDSGGADEIYLYRAESNDIQCLSCNANGAPPLTDRFARAARINLGSASLSPISSAAKPNAYVTADGLTAVFDSFDPLVPQDTNGKWDVYEWRNGALTMLTTGRALEDSRLAGITPDGRDVFFTTYDQLVARDVDTQPDLYDARVDGGVALDQSTKSTQVCRDDACQGAQTGRPELAAPKSSLLGGAGDVVPGPRPSFSLSRLTRAQRVALARRGRTTLTVKVNRAGDVRATATARVRGKSSVVASARKHASHAGKLKLSLVLSRAARRQLDKAGGLRVSLSVRFAGVSEPKHLTVKLNRPGASRKGSAATARSTGYRGGKGR